MNFAFDNGTVIFLLLVVGAKIVDAIIKSRKAKQQHEAEHDPLTEQRRVAEVQEQIRRRIAERRSGAPAERPPTENPPVPRPVFRPETTELPDPLAGGLRRVLDQVERRLQPAPAPEPPPLVQQHRRAEFERQQQLADQMKSIEDARALAQRRATHLAADVKAEAESERGVLTAIRARTLEDLRDPQALRRAFVLREVLGTPVGLR